MVRSDRVSKHLRYFRSSSVAPWGCTRLHSRQSRKPFHYVGHNVGAGASQSPALLTRRMPAFVWHRPIIVNAFVVPIYVAPLTGMPYGLSSYTSLRVKPSRVTVGIPAALPQRNESERAIRASTLV